MLVKNSPGDHDFNGTWTGWGSHKNMHKFEGGLMTKKFNDVFLKTHQGLMVFWLLPIFLKFGFGEAYSLTSYV